MRQSPGDNRDPDLEPLLYSSSRRNMAGTSHRNINEATSKNYQQSIKKPKKRPSEQTTLRLMTESQMETLIMHGKDSKHSRRSYCAGDQRRSLFICGFACTIMTGVLMLLLYYVILPTMVERAMEQVLVRVKSCSIEEPADSSFRLKMEAVLENQPNLNAVILSSSIHAYYGRSYLGNFDLPEIDILHPKLGEGNDTTHISIDTKFSLKSDAVLFASFIYEMFHEDSVEWRIVGYPTFEMFGLYFSHIKFEKILQFGGMSGLQRSHLANFTFDSVVHAEGVGVGLDIVVENPSNVGLDLGWVKFDILYKRTVIGSIISESTLLAPGWNLFHASGIVNQNLEHAGDVISRYLHNLDSPFALVPVYVANNSISWMKRINRDIKLRMILPGTEINLVSSVALDHLFLGIT